ncbi:MAG: ATP-binding protein [Bacteroidales bacterium]|nr:ATP-binding protein [Bacteroidales bacterium]
MKIAIASGKGGTGKTTLSVNLASFLSKEVVKEDQRVVLTDLDVEEPNSGIFFKGSVLDFQHVFRSVPTWDESKCSLCGKCTSWCNFNALARLPEKILVFPELCHSCYACTELCPEDALPMTQMKMGILNHTEVHENLFFIEGVLDVGQESAVPLIHQTKAYVEEHYQDQEIKLYDSPPGTSCPVIETVKDANFVVLVTEPTPFGLHDLKLAIATIRKLGIEFGVVINRHGIGDCKVEDYCSDNQIAILGKIPNMRKAANLYSQGKLLYDEIPEIKRELQKIYNLIKKQLASGSKVIEASE